MINSQTSRDKACMFLLRKSVITCMSFNVLFRAIHVPGLLNSVADALSCLQLARTRKLAPWLDQAPTPLPKNFNPKNIWPKPSWLHH